MPSHPDEYKYQKKKLKNIMDLFSCRLQNKRNHWKEKVLQAENDINIILKNHIFLYFTLRIKLNNYKTDPYSLVLCRL